MAKDKVYRNKRNELMALLKRDFNVEKLVSVSDDWYPNFPDNKVLVALKTILRENYANKENPFRFSVRFSAMGMDDFAMSKEVLFDNITVMSVYFKGELELFNAMPEVVDKEWFLEQGFKYD